MLKSMRSRLLITSIHLVHSFLDTCLIDNGGCNINSICSRDETTGSIKCICKIGYTNTGSETSVNCTGN